MPTDSSSRSMNDHVKSLIDQADILIREGRFPSAHFALKKVLRRQPDNISALIFTAELHLRNGKKTDSVDMINRLFEMDPSSFDSTLQKRLGHICFENELFFMAAQLFEWLRDKEKQDELSLYHSGISLRRLGDMDSAEQRFLECVKIRPEVAATFLQLGHVCKATGHTDRAVDHYKKYIALSATPTQSSNLSC